MELEGGLTVPRMVDLQRNILRAVETTQELVLDLKRVTEIDLSFLQLICSAQRYARQRGKAFSVTSTEEFEQAVTRYGFVRTTRGGDDESQICLWDMAGKQQRVE